jgi:hypothetical protein
MDPPGRYFMDPPLTDEKVPAHLLYGENIFLFQKLFARWH